MNIKTYSWYLAKLFRKLLSGSSTDRCLWRQPPITPTWCRSPRLVCETNSAAPPMGFVTTPISPLLMPDTKPVAVPETVPLSAVCARVKTCSGWSAMPASAPTQLEQHKPWHDHTALMSISGMNMGFCLFLYLSIPRGKKSPWYHQTNPLSINFLHDICFKITIYYFHCMLQV